MLNIFNYLNYQHCILTLHMHIFEEFVVLVCLCIYLPDDDLVDVGTCRRNISDELLFIISCAICWIK
jgi:hypothetical protein